MPPHRSGPDAQWVITSLPPVPEKEMLRLCNVRCPHVNQITLEDTAASLINVQYEIEIDEEIRRRALHSVERMLAIG